MSETEQIPVPSNWSQDRRFKFIDYRLCWDGRIRRTDLTDFFGISLPQASADLARYSEAAPVNLSYDLSQKCYVRASGFRAMYTRSSARMYMSELLAIASGVMEQSATFVGWAPPVGLAPSPVRNFDEQVLAVLVEAIREKRRLNISYQGMRSPEPTEREISPTAFAYDGMRWHARAYCHMRNEFRDFVVGRVVRAALGEKTEWSAQDDQQWNRMLVVRIGSHPGLSPAARKAIELEYGMVNGELELQCRHALLYYALRRLRLEESGEGAAAPAQQIVLVNREELAPYIAETESSGTGTPGLARAMEAN